MNDTSEAYDRIHAELKACFDGERDFVANMANCAAILFSALPQINWVGFYLLRKTDLVLGPFQGRPACTRIGPGRGVCGAAADRRKTVIVPNVHEFPGHIACDAASRSEIVVPLIKNEMLIGVLDLDSPVVNRFDERDAFHFEAVGAALLEASDV